VAERLHDEKLRPSDVEPSREAASPEPRPDDVAEAVAPDTALLVFGEPEAERRPRAMVVIAAGLTLSLIAMLAIAVGIDAVARSVNGRFAKIDRPLVLPPLPERSTIYAADGSVLERVYLDENRVVVPFSRFRRVTWRSVLAIEDHAFFEHGALDVRAIVRASIANALAGEVVQGGSTISQQLVKDVVTGDEVTWQRKITEAIDAVRLENTSTKRQILATYLNEVYLGHAAYGFGAAAEYYFAERVDRLSLAQSALLAGMIRAPTSYDPLSHPVHARSRRNAVLRRMHELGWVSAKAYTHARRQPIDLSGADRDMVAAGPNSYWTQFVIHSFLANPAFGDTLRQRGRALFQGGLRIYTTLEPAWQRDAEAVLRARIAGAGMPQSALVSIVPKTGAIAAVAVANWPFRRYRYDLATTPGGGRTAGSAFKAFTLAAALEAGISPNAVYNGDSPKTIADCGGGETWTVHNAEPGGGTYRLWQATAESVNAVFAQVIDQVGPDAVARVAHRMGITSALTPVCPLTLGTSPVSPLEMTSGYATLANDGVHCEPYAIERVVSSSGEQIYQAAPECSRAIPASVAHEETAMLEGVIRAGTGTAADIGRPEAGKTGTGQDYQDAWFVGYVPQLATGVWVGYAKAEIPMPNVPGYGRAFGGVIAAPIWHDYMAAATGDMPARTFASPPVPLQV
jgi:penicillin-binding protein 1A